MSINIILQCYYLTPVPTIPLPLPWPQYPLSSSALTPLPALFLFPEESVVRGSTSLFVALLKRCLDREVVAICRFVPRKNAYPEYVALAPQVRPKSSSPGRRGREIVHRG